MNPHDDFDQWDGAMRALQLRAERAEAGITALATTRAALTEALRMLREVREWHRCPWQHGASVEVIDLTRHAEWIARIDAAVLAQEEK